MRRGEAGYFIHDWQEITDQVRRMIFRDVRYTAIRERQQTRRVRKRSSRSVHHDTEFPQ